MSKAPSKSIEIELDLKWASSGGGSDNAPPSSGELLPVAAAKILIYDNSETISQLTRRCMQPFFSRILAYVVGSDHVDIGSDDVRNSSQETEDAESGKQTVILRYNDGSIECFDSKAAANPAVEGTEDIHTETNVLGAFPIDILTDETFSAFVELSLTDRGRHFALLSTDVAYAVIETGNCLRLIINRDATKGRRGSRLPNFIRRNPTETELSTYAILSSVASTNSTTTNMCNNENAQDSLVDQALTCQVKENQNNESAMKQEEDDGHPQFVCSVGTLVAVGTSHKRPKKEMDSSAPKKPQSAYIRYTTSIRDSVKKEFPGLSPTEIHKEVLLRFKNLSPDEKKYWEEITAQEKESYQRALEKYRSSDAPANWSNMATGEEPPLAKKQKLELPKKPFTAYIHFTNSIRDSVKQQYPSMSPVDVSNEMARRFKALNPEERHYWDEIVRQEREAFGRALELYNQSVAAASLACSHDVAAVPSFSYEPSNAHIIGQEKLPIVTLPPFPSLAILPPLHSGDGEVEVSDGKENSDMFVHDESSLANNSAIPFLKSKNMKQQKKVVDPCAPKKPFQPYIYFSNSIRDEIKKGYPEMSFSEVAKEMGRRFRELSPEERQYWQDVARQEKEAYDCALEAYVSNPVTSLSIGIPLDCGTNQKSLTKERKMETDPNAPKRPFQPYIYFSNSIRDEVKNENPDISFSDLGKEMGRRFKALSPEEHQYWKDVARQEKEAYERALEAYQVSAMAAGWASSSNAANNNATSSEFSKTKKTNVDPNLPKKPYSAYIQFANSTREIVKQHHPEMSPVEISREVARLFKELAPEERHYWDAIVRQEREVYGQILETYKQNVANGDHSFKPTTTIAVKEKASLLQPLLSDSSKVVPKSKPKKKQQDVDKNAPKKPYTAYIYFSNSIRENVRQQNPEFSFTDIAREMGRRFKELSPEDREYWQEVAKHKKERYDGDLEAYNATLVVASTSVHTATTSEFLPAEDEEYYEVKEEEMASYVPI